MYSDDDIIKTVSMIHKHYAKIEPEKKTEDDVYKERTWLTTLNAIKTNPSIYKEWFSQWHNDFKELCQ